MSRGSQFLQPSILPLCQYSEPSEDTHLFVSEHPDELLLETRDAIHIQRQHVTLLLSEGIQQVPPRPFGQFVPEVLSFQEHSVVAQSYLPLQQDEDVRPPLVLIVDDFVLL